MSRSPDPAIKYNLLWYLDTRRFSLHEIAKKLGKAYSTVQEQVKNLVLEGYLEQPLRASHKAYKSSRSIFALTGKGKEFLATQGHLPGINRPDYDRIGLNKPTMGREEVLFLSLRESGEYQSLHRGRIFIPFVTPKPAKLPYLAFRTNEKFTPRGVDKKDITNWDYIQKARMDIKEHQMTNWDWYSFIEKMGSKDLSVLVYNEGITICISDIQFPESEDAYDIITDQYLIPLQPVIKNIQERLNNYFVVNHQSWHPKLKEAEPGMYQMTLTGELAMVGDGFAKVVYNNYQKTMYWNNPDGSRRMHIDRSHPETGPELEFTNPGSFIDDEVKAKKFKEEIGKEQYREIAENSDPREFGDMILDHIDKKWSYKAEQIKLSETRKELELLKLDKERDVTQITSVLTSVTEKLSQIADVLGAITGAGYGGIPR